MSKLSSLEDLEKNEFIELGRGKVISRKDLQNFPGDYPVYSSSKIGEGKFGEYGKYDFDEDLITWSVDGGGKFFLRNKHKFSITNVTGYIRILKKNELSYNYLYVILNYYHSKIKFDWIKKAHPSVIRKEYTNIPIIDFDKQISMVAKLKNIYQNIDKDLEYSNKNLDHLNNLNSNIIEKYLSSDENALLKNEVSMLSGFAFESKKYSKTNEGIALLRGDNISPKEIDLSEAKYYPSSEYNNFKKYHLKHGDILIAMDRPIIKSGLKVAILDQKNLPALLVQRVMCLRPKTKILKEFIFLIVQSKKFLKQITNNQTGLSVPHISANTIGNFKFNLPNIEKQKNISNKIEKIETEIQNLKKLLIEKNEKLTNLKKLLSKKIFNLI